MVLICKKKNESSSPKDISCQVWLKLSQEFYQRSLVNVITVINILLLSCYHLPKNLLPFVCFTFKFSQCIFANLLFISLWKMACPLIWINRNSLFLRMICAKFGWNWSSGFWRGKFLNSVILLFCDLFSFGKVHGPSFEQTWILSPVLFIFGEDLSRGSAQVSIKQILFIF